MTAERLGILPKEEAQELWREALIGAMEYLGGGESPDFDRIGEELGGCTQDLVDLRALERIIIKAKGGK